MSASFLYGILVEAWRILQIFCHMILQGNYDPSYIIEPINTVREHMRVFVADVRFFRSTRIFTMLKCCLNTTENLFCHLNEHLTAPLELLHSLIFRLFLLQETRISWSILRVRVAKKRYIRLIFVLHNLSL